MSYNKHVEAFVIGDLVYFTGDEVESPPLAHNVGIVTSVGAAPRATRAYNVFWLHSGTIIAVTGKHLVLAYIREI